MVKRLGRPVLLLLLLFGCLAPPPAAAQDADCFYCGMRRADHFSSWVEIRNRDGSVVGFCSLHCAAIHLALHPEPVPAEILVGDYPSGRLIDADTAHWVIGGRKPGVMTSRAKWAFARASDADRFVAEHGGRRASVAEALKAATEDMYRDISVIQKKRNAARGKAVNRER